jgi:hypothetical protein
VNRRRRTRRPATAWLPPEQSSGYEGPATLHVDSQSLHVNVALDGHLEPLDGKYHWYGRIQRSAGVVAAKDAGATTGTLVIGAGAPAELRLAEYDAWGHVQVNGIGAPPYPLEAVQVDVPSLTC